MTEELQAKFENVMIIDDTSVDLYITSRIIEKNNFGKNLLKYATAEEALLYLEHHQENTNALPQVILVDIYMPMMSGFQFVEAYDKFSATLKNHCRVFVVSSTLNENDISRINTNKNVMAFQEKPITKQFLENINA